MAPVLRVATCYLSPSSSRCVSKSLKRRDSPFYPGVPFHGGGPVDRQAICLVAKLFELPAGDHRVNAHSSRRLRRTPIAPRTILNAFRSIESFVSHHILAPPLLRRLGAMPHLCTNASAELAFMLCRRTHGPVTFEHSL